jgi:uncharacterized protein (DUF983 family)
VTNALKAALFGRCPRCGKGNLFNGLLSLAPLCEACRLDFSVFLVGDGPAPFVILIVGAIVVASALYVEFTFEPPIWVHVALWLPIAAILTFSLLRFLKALLLILQFKNKAGEGRLTPPPS